MTTLSEILLKSYREVPDRGALYLQHAGQDDQIVSYADLVSHSSGYALALKSQGIQPGEVVVLILQHSQELIYSFFGAVLLGAIPSIMPFLTEKLSPERYRSDLTSLISVTKPAAVVTYPEFEHEIHEALQKGDTVRAVIVVEDSETAEVVEADQFSGLMRGVDDIVLLQHSSGTTGLQKGVALSHRAVLNQLDAYGKALKISEKDVVVSWLPLYHDMGLIAGFLMPILSRVPLVLMSPFDWVRAPYRLMKAVSKYGGTLSWLPNFAYNFCAQRVRERDIEGVDLSTWRAIINCSEPVRMESHQVFYKKFKEYGLEGNALQTSYAMAENVFGVTQSDVSRMPVVEEIDREIFMIERVARPASDDRPAMKMMSSGQVLSNTRVRILDENQQDLPERTIGEVALQSDCMLTGYYNRPDITKKAFIDGWYLTGDYGYLSKGELFVTGRKKDMLIVGGRNVYPQDIESIAYEVEGVHQGRAVVFGLYDEHSGTEEVVLIAEIEAKSEEERLRIADMIRRHVTKNSAIALRHVHIVEPKWILKTSSGKTARAANKEKYMMEMDIH